MAKSTGPVLCHTSAISRGFGSVRVWLAATAAVLARPSLWLESARLLGRVARPGWWRGPPFLPVPDRAYVRFRLETAYGADGRPSPDDLVAYLRWCREHDAVAHRARRAR